MTSNPKRQPIDDEGRSKLSMLVVGSLVILVLVAAVSYLTGRAGAPVESKRNGNSTTSESLDLSSSAIKGEIPEEYSNRGTLYVPIYSHISANGGTPFLLESTLSIRNVSPARSIVIESLSRLRAFARTVIWSVGYQE